ncbi:MAG: hypothetical protein ACEPOV_14925 [Hyphomicrobiales bacterium]
MNDSPSNKSLSIGIYINSNKTSASVINNKFEIETIQHLEYSEIKKQNDVLNLYHIIKSIRIVIKRVLDDLAYTLVGIDCIENIQIISSPFYPIEIDINLEPWNQKIDIIPFNKNYSNLNDYSDLNASSSNIHTIDISQYIAYQLAGIGNWEEIKNISNKADTSKEKENLYQQSKIIGYLSEPWKKELNIKNSPLIVWAGIDALILKSIITQDNFSFLYIENEFPYHSKIDLSSSFSPDFIHLITPKIIKPEKEQLHRIRKQYLKPQKQNLITIFSDNISIKIKNTVAKDLDKEKLSSLEKEYISDLEAKVFLTYENIRKLQTHKSNQEKNILLCSEKKNKLFNNIFTNITGHNIYYINTTKAVFLTALMLHKNTTSHIINKCCKIYSPNLKLHKYYIDNFLLYLKAKNIINSSEENKGVQDIFNDSSIKRE